MNVKNIRNMKFNSQIFKIHQKKRKKKKKKKIYKKFEKFLLIIKKQRTFT